MSLVQIDHPVELFNLLVKPADLPTLPDKKLTGWQASRMPLSALLPVLLSLIYSANCRITLDPRKTHPPPLAVHSPEVLSGPNELPPHQTGRDQKAGESKSSNYQLNFVDDVDHMRDSLGEYTQAQLNMTEQFPEDFTVCSAYTVEAFMTGYNAMETFTVYREDGSYFLGVAAVNGEYNIFWGASGTLGPYYTKFQPQFYPTQWVRLCIALSATGKMTFVVDGEVLHEPAVAKEFVGYPGPGLALVLHGWALGEDSHTVSNFNIFGEYLSTDRMVAMTQAGSEECGAPGDFLSWADTDWQLFSQAKKEAIPELDGPCDSVSTMVIYMGDFFEHYQCMEHCEKGNGRSPPVRTPQEWQWLIKNLTIISHDTDAVQSATPQGNIWLAGLDGTGNDKVGKNGVEGVWTDPYPPFEEIFTEGFPWRPITNGTNHPDRNCMILQNRAGPMKDALASDFECYAMPHSCPCQYPAKANARDWDGSGPRTHMLDLIIRGACMNSYLMSEWSEQLYRPRQLRSDPGNMMFVGQYTNRIRYNESLSMWVLTDMKSGLVATTRASKMSHAIGKFEWTVTGDKIEGCSTESYTTMLKLTGCNLDLDVPQFTCDDGQCIDMEQRCDQLPNCRDESDEENCQLLMIEDSYNKRIPPISMRDQAIVPVAVNVSIAVFKIVSMEEVQHKIRLQFKISLQWYENRALFNNLKKKTSRNALTEREIENIWLPYVIYDNTDMKEAVQLWDDVKTTVVVTREGGYTEGFVDILDEVHIYKGIDSKLTLYQTYTKEFQCQYNLQRYPFDTQVSTRLRINKPASQAAHRPFPMQLH